MHMPSIQQQQSPPSHPPPPSQVYVGSFNTSPIRTDVNPHGEELFAKEQHDLLTDLYEIPQRSCDRKVCLLCVKEGRMFVGE